MSKTWNEEKQKYEYSPSFTLELRLMTTPEDDAVLDKRFGICNHIYNVMVKEARKRLSNLYRDHEYKEIMYPYYRTGKFKTGDKKKLDGLRKKYGLTEYSFKNYLDAKQNRFNDNIDGRTRQKEASSAWRAVKDILFLNGKNIHFQKLRNRSSVEGNSNTTGIRYSNQRLHWKGLDIPVVVRKRDAYAKEVLRTCFVKYCRIVRKWHKHKYRYYVQLVMEGVPPVKENRQNYDDILHDGTPVGIDIGPSTIAVVSPDKVLFQELAADVSSIEKEIRHLNRKIERETRLANPDNYNANGTWKTNNPNRTYNKSRHQLVNEHKRKELYQKRKRLDDTTLVQRDLYSAFLLMNCTDTETISMEQCFDTFDDFKKKHDDCMTHLEMQKVMQNKKFPACMGVGTYILSV